MKDLITEARELCKYSEKIVNQLPVEGERNEQI